MRILLDESIRASFASSLTGHEVKHVEELGMKSLSNGELLNLARVHFEAFLTLDKGILHQHRHEGDLRVLVVKVPDSTIESLLNRLQDVQTWLASCRAGDRAEI